MFNSATDVVDAYRAHLRSPADQVIADLECFSEILEKWQRVQNLVSRETLLQVWSRHIGDSLQVLKLLEPGDTTFLDLGSGGGFPAIPMAIALKESDASFELVEPNNRKASFLRTVARELGLKVVVHAVRSDQLDSRETRKTDVITSRALASLPQLCAMAAPFFSENTRAILHKGREHVEELRESDSNWAYDVLVVPSDTDADGVLIAIRNLRRKTEA